LAGGIDSLESISGLLKSLKIPALDYIRSSPLPIPLRSTGYEVPCLDISRPGDGGGVESWTLPAILEFDVTCSK
jgi:hypothetical protein